MEYAQVIANDCNRSGVVLLRTPDGSSLARAGLGSDKNESRLGVCLAAAKYFEFRLNRPPKNRA